MKKILSILAIVTLLCSCAPEKRLARFLERHPELQRIDTVMIHDTIITPPDTTILRLTLQEIIAMDSAARAAQTEDTDTTIAAEASNDRSGAVLKARGDGTFDLQAITKPDTVYRDKPVPVPHYITEYKDREVEVYKQHWYQEGFMWIGILATLIAVLYIIIKALKSRFLPL